MTSCTLISNGGWFVVNHCTEAHPEPEVKVSTEVYHTNDCNVPVCFIVLPQSFTTIVYTNLGVCSAMQPKGIQRLSVDEVCLAPINWNLLFISDHLKNTNRRLLSNCRCQLCVTYHSNCNVCNQDWTRSEQSSFKSLACHFHFYFLHSPYMFCWVFLKF